MDTRGRQQLQDVMAGKKLRGIVGPPQGTPVERAYVAGQAFRKSVDPEAGEVIGLSLEIERTPTLESVNGAVAELVLEASFDGGVTWQVMAIAEVAGGRLQGRDGTITSSGVGIVGWGTGAVPTDTRYSIIPHRNFRTTERLRPLLLDVTPLPPG